MVSRSSTLSLRVAPEDAKQLFEQLGKVAKILEHRTESEDRTSTVIEVEAKIRNLTGLRDRLRQMLASPNGSLKDVVEVERELSKTQSELDSFQMRRKVLADETEKVFVDISFRSRKSVAETGAFAPIATAWQEAGHVLAASMAFAITFAVAVVPWLVLFIPTPWLLIKGIQRLRGNDMPRKSPSIEHVETQPISQAAPPRTAGQAPCLPGVALSDRRIILMNQKMPRAPNNHRSSRNDTAEHNRYLACSSG